MIYVTFSSSRCQLDPEAPVSSPKNHDNAIFNEVIVFCYFLTKMYFRCFKTFLLTHWCHMDYFDDVFISFDGSMCNFYP